MKSIPESSWRWFGVSGHLCVAHDCLYHLATEIKGFLISTVGNYRPRVGRDCRREGLRPMEEIGVDRFYETMVFKTVNGRCDCGCGLPKIDLNHVEMIPAASPSKADRNHLKACRRYAKRERPA